MIEFTHKSIKERSSNGYRVYSANGEVEIVEAETVSEAIKIVESNDIVKIEKLGVIRKSIFSKDYNYQN